MSLNTLTDVIEQIDELAIDYRQPLIISDADEVLFQFVATLERFLDHRGLWLDLQSFAISGNVKEKDSDVPYPSDQIPALLKDFFATATNDMDPVAGAAEALASLAEEAQIVVLTNIPFSQRHVRQETLANHGMPYPVIANEGLKGPAAAALAKEIAAPIFFLDDIPHNITSVRNALPHSRCIHFVADPRLAKLIPAAEHCDHRIDTWPEAHDTIMSLIKQENESPT